MKHNRLLLCGLLLSCFLLSGCLGSADIDQLALVMAVGLDEGEDPSTIQVTVQVARPADVVGQSGSPSAGTGEPIWTASATGHSLMEAMRNLAKYSSRRVYWAHNKVIVINEGLAKDVGINDIVDFFTRNHELRMRTWVVVTPDKASELVASKTGLEVVPGMSIEKLFRYNKLVGEAPRVDLRTLQAEYLSAGTEVVLPVVRSEPRGISTKDPNEFGSTPQVELSGVAYFEKDKMYGVLDAAQSRGLMWFVDSPKSRVVVLQCPEGGKSPVSLELKNHRFRVEPTYDRGHIRFNIRLEANFDMTELGCKTQRSNQKIMSMLVEAAQKELASEITDVIQTSQARKVDFLGLGERFQDRYPAEWKYLRPTWDDALSSAQVNVSVRAHIHSPVLLQTPTSPTTAEDVQP